MSVDSRLEALEEDFQSKLSQDLVKVEFPESDSPVYVRKTHNTFRKAPCLKAIAENKYDEFNALMIIQFAMDKDGSGYIFKRGNLDFLLKKVDAAVLARVAQEISEIIKFEEEEEPEMKVAKKNSEKGARSMSDSSSPES
jgi:hypothetical protein